MNENDLRIAAERLGLTLRSYPDGYALNDAWGLRVHPKAERITLADAEHYIGHEPMHRAQVEEFVRQYDETHPGEKETDRRLFPDAFSDANGQESAQ